MPRQSGPKPNFTCKLLILNRMKALSRFAEPFQNLSNHFKIEIEARPSTPAATGELTRYSWRGPPTVHDHSGWRHRKCLAGWPGLAAIGVQRHRFLVQANDGVS